MQEKTCSIITHVLVLALLVIFRNQFSVENIAYSAITAFMAIIGIIILSLGMATIDKALTSKKSRLITSGIYSKIRHPIYYGRILFFIGLTLFFRSVFGIVLIMILLVPLHIYGIREEERELVKKFGNKYIKYKNKTLF
ncbi:MAG: isoprenylcysteine carboxylmethyltransferase family protein [Candidatus Aenigmatarchaeota archaeon]